MARRKPPPEPEVIYHDSQRHPTKAEMLEPLPVPPAGTTMLSMARALTRPVKIIRPPRKKK